VGCEEFELRCEVWDAVDASARPALNQARVDQPERHEVVAVRRKVAPQAFDPLRGLAGDRSRSAL